MPQMTKLHAKELSYSVDIKNVIFWSSLPEGKQKQSHRNLPLRVCVFLCSIGKYKPPHYPPHCFISLVNKSLTCCKYVQLRPLKWMSFPKCVFQEVFLPHTGSILVWNSFFIPQQPNSKTTSSILCMVQSPKQKTTRTSKTPPLPFACVNKNLMQRLQRATPYSKSLSLANAQQVIAFSSCDEFLVAPCC